MCQCHTNVRGSPGMYSQEESQWSYIAQSMASNAQATRASFWDEYSSLCQQRRYAEADRLHEQAERQWWWV